MTQVVQKINEKLPGDSLYMAFFSRQTVALYAADLYQAKQLAVAYFKPTKKNMGLLSVVLHTNQHGEVVSHTIS